MKDICNWGVWLAIALQVLVSLFHGWRARRTIREWARLRGLNQLVWAYTKELAEKGVTLPPRCVCCVQILPRHVEGCVMESEYNKVAVTRERIRYYPKGEHPPHPEEEEPPPHAR